MSREAIRARFTAPRWTPAEADALRHMVKRLVPYKVIADRLAEEFGHRRSVDALYVRCQVLGIRRPKATEGRKTSKRTGRSGRYRWTEAMEEVLYANWGLRTAATLTRWLNRDFGTDFTKEAVETRAWDLGLSHADAQGDLTQADAAKALGISDSLMSRLAQAGEVKVYGQGKVRYVPLEEVERLRERFAAPPEPTISTIEAGKRLGYAYDVISHHCKIGRLRGWRYRGKWRVAVSAVNAVLAARQAPERSAS